MEAIDESQSRAGARGGGGCGREESSPAARSATFAPPAAIRRIAASCAAGFGSFPSRSPSQVLIQRDPPRGARGPPADRASRIVASTRCSPRGVPSNLQRRTGVYGCRSSEGSLVSRKGQKEEVEQKGRPVDNQKRNPSGRLKQGVGGFCAIIPGPYAQEAFLRKHPPCGTSGANSQLPPVECVVILQDRRSSLDYALHRFTGSVSPGRGLSRSDAARIIDA